MLFMVKTMSVTRSKDPEVHKFENVTVYTTGNVLYPCIVRIDARQASLRIAPYAQHERSVYSHYLPKRARLRRILVVPHSYVIVVPTKHAIDPDEVFLPAVGNTSETRYKITDPRWRTDFDEKLSRAKVPILLDYRGLF